MWHQQYRLCPDAIRRKMDGIKKKCTKTTKCSKAWNDDNEVILSIQQPAAVHEDSLTEDVSDRREKVCANQVFGFT